MLLLIRFNLSSCLLTLCQHLLPFILITALVFHPLYAASDSIVFYEGQTDLVAEKNALRGSLDNGLRYAVISSPDGEGLSIRMHVNAGSLNEEDDQLGVAHFLEHMAFNGTTNIPEGSLNPLLSRFGLSFGVHTNASTRFADTIYKLDFPSIENEALSTGLFVMREMASELLLEEGAIDRERGVIAAEFRSRSSPALRSGIALREFLFPDTRFHKRIPFGNSVSDSDRVTRDSLKRFYDRHYSPENTTVVISAPMLKQEVVNAIDGAFADWEPREYTKSSFDLGTINENRQLEASVVVESGMSASVSINTVQAVDSLEDTRQRRTQELAQLIAVSIVNQRIQKKMLDEENSVLDARVNFERFENFANIFTVGAAIDSDKWEAGLSFIEKEVRRALQYGFSKSEIDIELQKVRAALEANAKGKNFRTAFVLAEREINALIQNRIPTDPLMDFQEFEKLEPTFRENPDILSTAFSELVGNRQPLLYARLNNPLESAEQQVVRTFKDSLLQKVNPPTLSAVDSFQYENFGPRGRIVSDDIEEVLGARILKFENNVRLNLLVTDNEEGQISLHLRMGGGLLEFSNAPEGLVNLMRFGFTNAGLVKHGVEELTSILAGRRVSAGLNLEEDSFGGAYTTTADDLQLQLQLITAYITNPGFRPEWERNYKQQMESLYRTLSSSPGSVAQARLNGILHGGDSRYGLAPLESLLLRNFEELESVLRSPFNSGAIELAIVGDFEQREAIEAVASTLGALEPRREFKQNFPKARAVAFPDTKSRITLTHTGDSDDALLFITWKAFDDSDERRVQVANLVEGVFNQRLLEKLREELSLTYSPQSQSNYSSLYPDFGYMGFVVEGRPDDLPLIEQSIIQIAKDMAGEKQITDDDLEKIRLSIVETIRQLTGNDSFLASLISKAQFDSNHIDSFEQAKKILLEIQAHEVTEFVSKYLSGVDPLVVLVVPE